MKYHLPLVLLFTIICLGCNNGQQGKGDSGVQSTTDTTTTEPNIERYKVLNTDDRGSFKNLDVLILTSGRKPADVATCGGMIKALECTSTPCNSITIWDNENALKLYQVKQNNTKWRKKNWVFICEHYVADYNVAVSEMNLYPFEDSEYRKWGGKKKRPSPSSFDIH